MAMQKLSKAYIEGYPLLENGQIFIRDTKILGFGIKITKTSKVYFVERKLFGKTKRVTLGKHGALTLNEAKVEAKKVLGDLAKGIDVTRKRKQNDIKEAQQLKKSKLELTTLKEAYIAFLANSGDGRKESTIKKYDHSIYDSLGCWVDTPLINITADMVADKHRVLVKKSATDGNHTMRVLRAVFNHAMETIVLPNKQYLINRNPVARLSKTKSWANVPARTVYIKSHQLKEWWDASEQETSLLRDYLRFVLLTGVRRENAASLKWCDIDFKDKTFTILAKNKDEHLPLPLSNYLLTTLTRRYQQSNSQYVFPSTGKTGHLAEPRKSYKRIEERTGIEATIHDLRRSFAHYAAEISIPQYIVKRLMLHSLKGDVTDEHYMQHSIEQLRKPSQRIEDYILSHIQEVDNVVPLHNKVKTA